MEKSGPEHRAEAFKIYRKKIKTDQGFETVALEDILNNNLNSS